jgi:predicted membrane channel-forming protein YqfA (hemolysin III family)
MSHTHRTLLIAATWLFAAPLLFLPLLMLTPSEWRLSIVASVLWGLGFIGLFARWSMRDSAEHGKSKNTALFFTLAWFLVFFLAVFPYLFVTRGAKLGLLAALQFFSYCTVCGIGWLSIPLVTRTFL